MKELIDRLRTAHPLDVNLPEVADAIDRLQIECETLRHGLRLKDRQVEHLSRDALRYQWLRNLSVNQWQHPIVVSQERQDQGMRYVGPLIGESLDAAIDAAMGKTTNKVE